MLPLRLTSALPIALLALAGTPGSARAGITGVCPDGSIFVVSRPEAIPCDDAKRVEPSDVPPLRPEFLPRPYGWERFNERNDPNNPYNLVDRDASADEPGDAPAPPPAPSVARTQPAPPAPRAARAPAVAVGEDEVRDLFLITEYAQSRAPARFADAGGVVVRLAHSAALESRVGGETPVVLFSAAAEQAGDFYANFTFVQDHMAFHPDAGDPHQLGLIHGELGPLAAGDAVLGYAVLPGGFDLTRPLDVYWDDRRLAATLRP